MEMVLTGRNFSADDAERRGLISRVVREGNVVDEAVKVASTIAKKGQIAVQAAKEGVNACKSPIRVLQKLDCKQGCLHSVTRIALLTVPFFPLHVVDDALRNVSFRTQPAGRNSIRASPLPELVRDQGPEGRYGCFRRKAKGHFHARVIAALHSIPSSASRMAQPYPTETSSKVWKWWSRVVLCDFSVFLSNFSRKLHIFQHALKLAHRHSPCSPV